MAVGGRTGEKKSRIRLSKLYSYACMRPTVMENDALLTPMGGPGFSRIVFGNQSHRHRQKPLKYRSNYVSTTKYNLITFLPKALFEQFRRVANMYFLLTACLSLTEIAPVQPASMIAPLVFVVGISMIKEAIEDWRRFQQDREVNSRKVKVHVGNGNFVYNEWKNIRVGDVVKVEKDHFFPADLLMISSNYPDGVCYVETMNLDGETNLKLKKSLEATLELDADEEFRSFVAQINCEDPNPNLYTFVGNLEYEGATLSVGPQQILLRDSKLRNTQYVYGVVIFSGHDTKVMQNSTDPPSKRSRIERKMDHIIYLLFSVLLFISLVGSIVFGIRTALEMPSWWYLQPEEADISFNPDNAFVSAILHFFSALILYGYLIPISLYVSIEVVKVWQASFINQDLHMYHEESDKPAHARTSNLNEELGQVDTVLSDKTGTLTCNMMEFLKCSIAGISYGVGVTEVEMAVQKRMQDSPHEFHEFLNESNEIHEESGTELLERRHVKGFNFQDDRLMKGQWVHEAKPDVIAMFFRILAVCHTAIPDENEETGAINYEAESPDESAFVVAARELGFEFYKRSQTSVYIKEFDKSLGQQVEREYKILNLLEFNSTRKRMSVVVQDEDGQKFLFCKGADSVIYDRLAKNGREYEEETRKHLASYADAGLRTLALSYRRLDESEYSEWNSVFLRAKTTIGLNRDSELEAASDLIEKDLILVGATAVEDKLQKGVPQCIDRLALAGLKIWVLTGDKMETAINIGFACSLLRQGMQQIVVTLDNANVKATEELGIKENIAKVSKESIQQQLTIGMQQITMEMNPDIDFALIIDGKALNYALEDDMKDKFLHLAIKCASVICCRVSPKQKAMVTRLVKEGKGKTTLAIGDGANDVGMIQEADIGVGISGVEGMQAVMASDFSIAQFCYLERLLIVHGHWCYKRIATMICYFFYKNIVFGLTLFYYEAYTSFSGQALYNDWLMTLFNVFFSSLPVISLGVFEQDVSGDTCLEFPALYQQGPQNKFFGWARISSWMGNGVYASAVSFYITAAILKWQAFQEGGQLPELDVLGSAMYTYIVWTVNCQIALTTSHFTWIQHLCIWGSIGLWYIFLYIFGLLSPDYSTTVFQILSEALAPSPIFWLATLLVPLLCILPYFAFTACQRVFFPMDHHIIQEIKHSKKDQDDPEMWSREKAKAVEKASIGFTATVESRLRHLRKKLQNRNFRDRKK